MTGTKRYTWHDSHNCPEGCSHFGEELISIFKDEEIRKSISELEVSETFTSDSGFVIVTRTL